MKNILVTRANIAIVIFTLLGLTACSAAPRLIGNPEDPYPLKDPKVGDLIHLATGHKVSAQAMLDAIGDTRVIYIGETHDNPASHQLQLEVLEGLYRKHPGQLTLAMEMFTPEQQPVLDRWSAGELEEKEFLRQVGWFENWQMNFGLYRPLLDFCRIKRIPVIGLNAPKALVRLVGQSPLTELPAKIQAQLPEFDFSDPYQLAMTESIFGGHSKGKAMSAGFIRVQTLWDETMAQNLATYLQSPLGEDRQLLVIAGSNHVHHGFGIPRRVHRRVPSSYLLIGSEEIEIPEEREAQLMDVELPQLPMRPWDFVQLTRYEKLNIGVKLGLGIDDDPQGIRVSMIVPNSVAEKSGIEKGDILLQAGETELKRPFDLLYLLMNTKTGDSLQISLQRGPEQLNFQVTF
jgi:uncharacterized iron-regulated protein